MEEAKAKIQAPTSQHPDKRCPWGKRPLKMLDKTRENQSYKAQLKAAAATPPKPANSSQRSEKEIEATSNKARKEKKKMTHWGRRKKRKSSTPAIGVNAIDNPGKKRKDPSEITCFNCNKKSHHFWECIEPKEEAPKIERQSRQLLCQWLLTRIIYPWSVFPASDIQSGSRTSRKLEPGPILGVRSMPCQLLIWLN